MRGQPTIGKRSTEKDSLIKTIKERWGVEIDPNDRSLYVQTPKLREWAEHGPFRMGASLANPVELKPMKEETEKEIAKRIATRYRILDTLVKSVIDGDTRALTISGPAGLGKSFNVEKALREYDPKGIKHTIIKGFATPVGLLKQLWDHRQEGQILVLDDADSVFFDDKGLNLLKAACDTTEQRVISYLSEGQHISEKDSSVIDKVFDFNGAIIFITNYDFDEMIVRGHRLAKHFEAMQSRTQYIDTSMRSRRDYLVRIKQVAETGLLDDLKPETKKAVLKFVENHKDDLRELSIRMAIKIGILTKTSPDEWEEMAKITCFRKA